MLKKGQIIIFLLFLINQISQQAEDSERQSGKSKFASNESPNKPSDTTGVRLTKLSPSILRSNFKSKEPIKISGKFFGNNGRIHKLFLHSNDLENRRNVHEIKLRLRRDLSSLRDIELGRDITIDDYMRSKRDLSEASAKWRTPRDHQFVTKTQLKVGRNVAEDPLPPVIKVYSMPDDNMSKVIRAGKSRDFAYARAPTKRIIYYATLPEIIRRPTTPEWLSGRQSGAFLQKGISSSLGTNLFPPFPSGGGQESPDIARIQSAIMDVRPTRDHLGSVSPQFTVVDIDRYTGLNDISANPNRNPPLPSNSLNSLNSLTADPLSNPGQSLTDNSPISGVTEPPVSNLLPPLGNNYISNLVAPLQMGNPFTGYQNAPYYTAPFPTRHNRFPYSSHNYQPYQSPLNSIMSNNYNRNQQNNYYNPGVPNYLSPTKMPYYYEYTNNRVDPLKNHLLFSPTWSTPYDKVSTTSTHSSHSVALDSQSLSGNLTSVTTANSTRITPPVASNSTQSSDSRES